MSVREAELTAGRARRFQARDFDAPSSESGPERPGGAAAKSGK